MLWYQRSVERKSSLLSDIFGFTVLITSGALERIITEISLGNIAIDQGMNWSLFLGYKRGTVQMPELCWRVGGNIAGHDQQ